jgi:NADH:ubiquinone oxidoreductase subunit 3 (subunit A)
MQPYLGQILLLAILALAMPGAIVVGVFWLTRRLNIRRATAPTSLRHAATETYESGMVPIGDAWIQYHIQYYLYGLIFVIFDVEVLFLYPWAVVFRHVGVNALIEVVIFILILFIGLIYAWRRGALRWA